MTTTPPPDVPQPRSVSLAVKLMVAGAAVSLLSLVISIVMLGSVKGDIREELRKDDVTVSQSTVDTVFAIFIVVGIVFGAIAVLLWLWMAWKNGQGRAWARIVATVLGGINVLATLIGFVGPGSEPVTLVLSVVDLVLAVVILVLLWRKESSEFFSVRSRPQLIR